MTTEAIRYELFSPCADALSGDEPPTFHSQCHGRLGTLWCSCECHPWHYEGKNK